MKEKNRLFSLALLMLLTPIGIMVLAIAGMYQSQRTVETLARSYVESLTESVASRLETREDTWSAGMSRDADSYDGKLGLRAFAGLGRLPGIIVVLDDRGAFLYGSSRLHSLIREYGEEIPVGVARELRDESGEKYTVAVFPAPRSGYHVIGAITWNDMPGVAVRMLYLWPTLAIFIGIGSAISLWYFWRRAIRPIARLEAEMSSLKWGEEIPIDDAPNAVYELHQLRTAFIRVALDAVARMRLIRLYLNDIVGVQEQERAMISRDIHDGPLQDVTALIQRIHLASAPNNAPEETADQLRLADRIAQETVKEMRRLCDFLNPPWLELGLQHALVELTERQAMQYNVRIFLDIDEDLFFSEGVTLAFFRVVQEAVNNSVRHGDAKNVWVGIREEYGVLEVSVQDDGKGFVMHKNGTAGLRVEGHRGLANIEERLALVGGKLQIFTYPGDGTRILGLVPSG